MASSSSTSNKLKLVVFDLDYTMWPFWVDYHVEPPFSIRNNKVVDSKGEEVKVYKEATSLLEYLHSEGYDLAVASRTGEYDGAMQLIKLFGWEKYFKYLQIYPGCKINHFNKLKSLSGYEFSEMLFFDDEPRNKYDLDKIGVMTIMVECGVSLKLFREGLAQFEAR